MGIWLEDNIEILLSHDVRLYVRCGNVWALKVGIVGPGASIVSLSPSGPEPTNNLAGK